MNEGLELHATPAIVVLTGSGISAESGISTFRDVNGLWRNHRIDRVASPEGFASNPALVHEFYDHRRRAALEAEPNAAHRALALLEKVEGGNVLIITQNVDDLQERSGSTNVIHMHGELNSALCIACGRRHRWTDDLCGNPPCPTCGELAMRPDIVWFGESVYRFEEILRAVDHCELFVVIGTSGTVAPAAGLAARARAAGATTQLLNLEGHEHSASFDWVRLGAATVTVPQLVEEIFADELVKFEERLQSLTSVFKVQWRRLMAQRVDRLQTAYAHEHPEWDPEFDVEPPDLALARSALKVEASREFLANVEALSAADLARLEQQSKAEEKRELAEKARTIEGRRFIEEALARERDQHRANRLKRAGRPENLYIASEALADAPFRDWHPRNPYDVPGLLPGAREAIYLHRNTYNVVLIARQGMPLDGNDPTFWSWYVRHFGSGEGLWPDQLMMNWSSSRLMGWDVLVVPMGHSHYYSENGGQIIELGSLMFPDWPAVLTYLENRD